MTTVEKKRKTIEDFDAELTALKAQKLLEDANKHTQQIAFSNGLLTAILTCVSVKTSGGTIDDVIKDLHDLVNENVAGKINTIV